MSFFEMLKIWRGLGWRLRLFNKTLSLMNINFLKTQEDFLNQETPKTILVESDVEKIGNGKVRVTAPFTKTIKGEGEHFEFTFSVSVKPGYESDLASIPKSLWGVIGHPFTAEFQDAALAHDVICDHAKEHKDYELRTIGDGFFFWVLKEKGVSYKLRKAMLWGVRLHAWLNLIVKPLKRKKARKTGA